jgi:glucose-6-phosphate isomerase
VADEQTALTLDVSRAEPFLPPDELRRLAPAVEKVAGDLEAGRGPGSDYLGWLNWPAEMTAAQLTELEDAAARARGEAEVYVVIGIGGSYLGARAVLDALEVGKRRGQPEILFAGTNLCSRSATRLLEQVRGRDLHVCVISKSGTTLEPAVAFRLVRALMLERYDRREAADRITAVTDTSRGALRRMAEAEGFQTFVIPENVGGRFSVLTPVGLLPLAVAGVDIRELVRGAATMQKSSLSNSLHANPAHLYAATRFALYEQGFTTEILSTFRSGLGTFQEWWRQLFGESEGKDGKGIFPASTQFTTDLHSLGQYIQDGRRQLQETFLCVREGEPTVTVPQVDSDDGLDYLVGKPLDEINWLAYEGTRKAHLDGGVPCLSIELQQLTPFTLGALIYFFQKAVAVGGRLLGVNPFDQPGVEAYKREMFSLLGKP